MCVRVKRCFLFTHRHFSTFPNPEANHVTACLDPFFFPILPAILFFRGCFCFDLAVVGKVCQNLQSRTASHSVASGSLGARTLPWRSLLSADRGDWEAPACCSPVNLCIGIFSEQRLQGRDSQHVFIQNKGETPVTLHVDVLYLLSHHAHI